MSVRNLEKAKQYSDHIICERKSVFYRGIRERTEEWLKRQA
jgi:hypothetical protein